MLVSEENLLVAPCGLFCGGCYAFLAKDDPRTVESLVKLGMKREKLPCPGCRSVEGMCPVMSGQCATYRCADNRRVEFCYQCSDFPCAKLTPTADKAAILPHNTKVFNLCFIREKGLNAWTEEAPEILNKYFKGKMDLGIGPRVE